MTRAGPWACLFLLCSTSPAYAFSAGLAGYSSKPVAGAPRGCDICHSGGLVPTVTLTGSANLAVNAKATYTLTLTGGPAKKGGAGIALDGTGAKFSPPAAGMPLRLDITTGELLNAGPTAWPAGAPLTYTFDVVAPPTAGKVTVYASVNSADGDLSSAGDGAANAKLEITVTGGAPTTDAGTPPPPPDAGTPVVVPDAGTGGGVDTADAGQSVRFLGAARNIEGEVDFGCSAASGLPLPLALGVLVALLRKRRRSV